MDKYAPVFETAHQLGAVPLVWLASLRSAGREIGRVWWLLALAFLVSWIADWISHWTGTFPVGPAYLTLQGGLVVWALAPREQAARYSAVLAGTAAFVMLNFDPQTPDIFVHTVAWLGLLAVGWAVASPRLRLVLGVAFGLGWLAWLGYCLRPGWTSWVIYQGNRLLGILVFCWASWKPQAA